MKLTLKKSIVVMTAFVFIMIFSACAFVKPASAGTTKYHTLIVNKKEEGKYSPYGYVTYARISGKKLVLKGTIAQINSKYQIVKRRTFKTKKSFVLSSNAKFYTEGVDAKKRISKQKMAFYLKHGPIGLTYYIKNSKVVEIILSA